MRILMCRPDFYDVVYEINPWMDTSKKPNKALAKEQWENLYRLYRKLNVDIQLIEQGEDVPDMVFTANGGIVYNNIFISGHYRFKERQGEEPLFQKWFSKNGFEIKTLEHFQGGEGDALMYQDIYYMGYGFRSDKESHDEIAQLLHVPKISIKLVDPYFYDFDTTFCPVGDRGVLYFPDAYDEHGKEIAAQIDGAIALTREQAENFVCNSVYVDGKLLVGFLDEGLKNKLKKIDVEPILLNMSEFKKAGGGIKCLTLYIEQ